MAESGSSVLASGSLSFPGLEIAGCVAMGSSPVHVSLCVPYYKDTVILDQGPPLVTLTCHFHLTICKDPHSKSGHVHRFCGLGLQHILGRRYSTHNSHNYVKYPFFFPFRIIPHKHLPP